MEGTYYNEPGGPMKLGELMSHYVKSAAIILWAALERDHTNLPLIIRAAEAIARLLKVQEKLSSAQKREQDPGCSPEAHHGHRYPHRRPLPVVALQWCNFRLQVQFGAIKCDALRTQVLLTPLIEPP